MDLGRVRETEYISSKYIVQKSQQLWEWPATLPGASERVNLPKFDHGPLPYRGTRLHSSWKPYDVSIGFFQNRRDGVTGQTLTQKDRGMSSVSPCH